MMYSTTPTALDSGSWANVLPGCRIHCTASLENEGYLVIGSKPHAFEFSFPLPAMRELVEKSTAVLATMEENARRAE